MELDKITLVGWPINQALEHSLKKKIKFKFRAIWYMAFQSQDNG
jgi:hypothetical protein